jgi:hypothetical protein
MKIVIEVSDTLMEYIVKGRDLSEEQNDEMALAIANGTPLDKIRERISLEKLGYPPSAGYYRAIMKVLEIIDKYKSESGDKW